MLYLAPYTGCTMGEYCQWPPVKTLDHFWWLLNQQACITADRLIASSSSTRSWSYPGDVFYLHSSSSERAFSCKRWVVEEIHNGEVERQNRLLWLGVANSSKTRQVVTYLHSTNQRFYLHQQRSDLFWKRARLMRVFVQRWTPACRFSCWWCSTTKIVKKTLAVGISYLHGSVSLNWRLSLSSHLDLWRSDS